MQDNDIELWIRINEASAKQLESLTTLSINQLKNNETLSKTIKLILITSVITTGLICSVFFYYIYQQFNYEGFAPNTNITNTNTNGVNK